MPETPLISVIIPSYNGAKDILSAIETVCRQTYPNIEIIVIDDGSKDRTATLLDEYRLQHQGDANWRPLTVISQPNTGTSQARNNALKQAKGDYVAYLDSDDGWHPDKLSLQLADLQGAPEGHWLSVTNMRSIYADGRVVDKHYSLPADLNVLMDEWYPLPSCWMARRETIELLGGFDSQIHYAEDLDLILRLCELEGASGVRVVTHPTGQPMFYYAAPADDKVYRHQSESVERILDRHLGWLRAHLEPDVLHRFLGIMKQKWIAGVQASAKPADPDKSALMALPIGAEASVS